MTSVDVARDYADRLVRREYGGPGDMEPAMRRVASSTGIGFSTLWGLRYRPPKTIDAGVFAQVKSAYLAICEHQLSRLKEELKTDAARGERDADQDLVVEAETLVAKLKAARAPR